MNNLRLDSWKQDVPRSIYILHRPIKCYCRFIILHLRVSTEYRHIFLSHKRYCGLVAELYLFISYALPLTMLRVAFGSDCLMLSHLGFPANSAIIIIIVTYEDVILNNSGIKYWVTPVSKIVPDGVAIIYSLCFVPAFCGVLFNQILVITPLLAYRLIHKTVEV